MQKEPIEQQYPLFGDYEDYKNTQVKIIEESEEKTPEELAASLKKNISEVLKSLPRQEELEKDLHGVVDIMLQAQYKEEANYYSYRIDGMLIALSKNYNDFLGIQEIETEMLSYMNAIILNSQKGLEKEDFEDLISVMNKSKNKFIKKAQDLMTYLNELKPPSYQLAIKKLDRLIDQMTVIETTFYLIPEERKFQEQINKLSTELQMEIQKLDIIASTDAGDFAVDEKDIKDKSFKKSSEPNSKLGESKENSELNSKLQASKKSSELNSKLRTSLNQKLDSLTAKKEEIKVGIGAGIALAGTPALLGQVAGGWLASGLDIGYGTGTLAYEGRKATSLSEFMKFIKEKGADIVTFLATVIGLPIAIVHFPPAVPILLQVAGIIDLSKDGIKLGMKLRSTKLVDKAEDLTEDFLKNLKDGRRLGKAVDSKDEKTKGPPELQEQKIAYLTQHLIFGKKHDPINQEIENLVKLAGGDGRMREKLLFSKSTRKVIESYPKNSPELEEFWKKLIKAKSPEERAEIGKEALKQQVTDNIRDRFLETVSRSLLQESAIFTP